MGICGVFGDADFGLGFFVFLGVFVFGARLRLVSLDFTSDPAVWTFFSALKALVILLFSDALLVARFTFVRMRWISCLILICILMRGLVP